MILFRCPACGTAHRAEPQYAGGMIPCRQCGQQVPIPHASDPACGLVYRAGEAEEGLPMTLDDIRLKLLSGELSETDLIWDGNTWKPLTQTVGTVREGSGLRLKPRAEPKAEEPELEAPLMPMDGVQKVDMSEIQDEQTSETKKKRFQLVRRHEASAEKKPAEAAAVPMTATPPAASAESPQKGAPPEASAAKEQPKPAKRRGRVYYGIQCTLCAFAIICGYKLGFGPLVSHYRDKPCTSSFRTMRTSSTSPLWAGGACERSSTSRALSTSRCGWGCRNLRLSRSLQRCLAPHSRSA